MAKMMVFEENFKLIFCGIGGAGETCTWRRYCTGMRKDGVWGGSKELLAAAELWNLRIVVVRLVLVGKGERIVWLKLESRHYEFLGSGRVQSCPSSPRNLQSCLQQVGLCER